MGLGYYIGWNESQTEEGKEWTQVDLNSYASALINRLISTALKEKYPDLFFEIMKKEPIHLIEFDELNQQEFMTVVAEIRNVVKNADESMANHVFIWSSEFEPLILIDDRYDPDFKL